FALAICGPPGCRNDYTGRTPRGDRGVAPAAGRTGRNPRGSHGVVSALSDVFCTRTDSYLVMRHQPVPPSTTLEASGVAIQDLGAWKARLQERMHRNRDRSNILQRRVWQIRHPKYLRHTQPQARAFAVELSGLSSAPRNSSAPSPKASEVTMPS